MAFLATTFRRAVMDIRICLHRAGDLRAPWVQSHVAAFYWGGGDTGYRFPHLVLASLCNDSQFHVARACLLRVICLWCFPVQFRRGGKRLGSIGLGANSGTFVSGVSLPLLILRIIGLVDEHLDGTLTETPRRALRRGRLPHPVPELGRLDVVRLVAQQTALPAVRCARCVFPMPAARTYEGNVLTGMQVLEHGEPPQDLGVVALYTVEVEAPEGLRDLSVGPVRPHR